MASIYLISTSLYRNPGYLFLWGFGYNFELAFATDNSCLWFSETLPRPLWNTSGELGLPPAPFCQQPVPESPQLRPHEGPAESGAACSASPPPCHRLHSHAFDFSRTRNIQEGSEGTWAILGWNLGKDPTPLILYLLPQSSEDTPKSAFASLFVYSYIWPRQGGLGIGLGLNLTKKR